MESIISYIVIISLVIISIYIYNIRKKQTHDFVLSKQNFPKLTFSVNIQKSQGNTNAILIKAFTTTEITIVEVRVELITASRDFNYYNLNEFIKDMNLPTKIMVDKETTIPLAFSEFKSLLADGEHPFRTFRFVLVDDSGKVYKSHELGFNKKWIIYRPDSGSYN